MKKKNKKLNFKIAMIFYVFAVVSLIAFMISCYNVTTYIMSVAQAGGLSITESLFDIIGSYLTNGFSFLIDAVILFGIGYIVKKLEPAKIQNILDVQPEQTDKEAE